MTDAGVPSLAEALNKNTTLKRLVIDGSDAITDNGLTSLVEVLSRSSRLVELMIPWHLKVVEVNKTINEARNRNGLEAIKVDGKYSSLDCHHGNCSHMNTTCVITHTLTCIHMTQVIYDDVITLHFLPPSLSSPVVDTTTDQSQYGRSLV